MDRNGHSPIRGENDNDHDDNNVSSPAKTNHQSKKNIVKEQNMNTIYVKTSSNAGSLQVGVPTTAMMEGGTETRLFFTVITLLVVFLTPALLLIRKVLASFLFSKNLLEVENLAQLLENEHFMQGMSSILTLILLFTPLYGTWRYQYGLLNALFLTIRMICLPSLMIFCIMPQLDSTIQIGLAVVLSVTLFVFRFACEGPPPTKDGKFRILIIGDAVPPKVDGVATFAENSIQYLHSVKGHEIHLVTSIAGPEKLFGCNVTRLPGMTTPISPGHSITLPLPSVLLVFLKFKPHCVHLFEVSPLNLATFVYCQLVDVPVTFSHHTRLDLYINIVTPQFPIWLNALILFALERLFYPLGDGHLCVSRVLYEKVKKRGTRNVRFWDSGVSAEFARSKFSAETRLALSGGDVELPLVCHVGRLGPEKNSEEIPEILAETWKIMKGKVRFAIVGDGILKQQVAQELVEKFKIKHCAFPGFLRGNDLQTAYASCDVFFSPSTTEGFPLVFLEAMASGLAVVGPIAGGVPDGFTEGVQGCLYDPHDAKSAARAIKKAIDGGHEMREKAYQRGKEFSWPHSVQQLEDLLRFVVRAKEQSGWNMRSPHMKDD